MTNKDESDANSRYTHFDTAGIEIVDPGKIKLRRIRVVGSW